MIPSGEGNWRRIGQDDRIGADLQDKKKQEKSLTTKSTKDTKYHEEEPRSRPFVIPSLRGI
jgi:hypothetical protein